MFPSVLQLNSEAQDGDGGWRRRTRYWKEGIFASRGGNMSQDMDQKKVVRNETPREAVQRARRESQGCLTESATKERPWKEKVVFTKVI